MAEVVRFILVGGFLGAGKTTTLVRLARWYQSRGQKVGLITNDQAAGLVDTANLKAQGLPVAEVAGACFCCRFQDLLDRVDDLRRQVRPDVLLAEPVGSCTDLVATVIQPLKDLYGERFRLAPYAVLFKPSHGLKILATPEKGTPPAGGFSPKAAYLFHKQLEEADVIVLNRIDELEADRLAVLRQLVQAHFPQTPLLAMSARTGQGFEDLIAFLEQEGNFGRRILDLDYDLYAAGEAEMGWFNGAVQVTAGTPFSLDDLLLEIVQNLQKGWQREGAEIAHVKVIGLGDTAFAVANVISNQDRPELSVPSNSRTSQAELTLNARVAQDPQRLQQHVQEVVAEVASRRQLHLRWSDSQSFRPGRPQPTYRYAAAV